MTPEHLAPLGSEATFVEDFSGPVLDTRRWVDHYLPHWTTPERSRARYDLTGAGLRLRIDADQPDWRPEDAPLRVSNLQTATFAGPLGSTRGTHRHRPDGLLVRTEVPTQLLWAPSAGQVDVTVTASTDTSCMLAAWLVGTEHLHERDSGEICLFEIDADAVGEHSTTARVGIKAHHDPRLTTDTTEVVVPVGRGQAHTWSARWDDDGVRVACEGGSSTPRGSASTSPCSSWSTCSRSARPPERRTAPRRRASTGSARPEGGRTRIRRTALQRGVLRSTL